MDRTGRWHGDLRALRPILAPRGVGWGMGTGAQGNEEPGTKNEERRTPMNWLNLEIRSLRSPAYMGSDPVERATWINLLAFCCEQENGGRIVGAKLWRDRQWQQMCGVTAREVNGASNLMRWEGDDLIVNE